MDDENMSRYRDWPKNPRRGVQMAPEHKRVFGAIRPIWHFWSAKRHSKRAEFCFGGLWPNGLQVMIRHTLFDIFAKGCVRIQTLIVRTYFLELYDLYKQRLNFIIQKPFLYALGSICFRLSNFSYFLSPSLSVAA